jgi:NAD-dependent oxidoreductase involved in siderophore biosynthesis
LEGTHVPPGQWTTTITSTPEANATFSALLKATALQHLHASLFSPATQTWIKAILNNHFTTWPSFTIQEVRKHLPKSTATAMGHLDQQRKNLKSTKKKHKTKNVENNEGIEDSNPAQETPINAAYDHMAQTLRDLAYNTCVADHDVWMKPKVNQPERNTGSMY